MADAIAVGDLPFDADEFDPCEEGENNPDEIKLGGGALAFGITSRHILATWLTDAFDKWGVKYRVVSGWQDRGRPISSGYFDPNGLLIHHTGSTSSATNPAPSLGTVTNGRTDLKGPLCQISTGFDGVTTIVAAGRANHAGSARAAMGNPAGDGNAMYLGNEVQTSGTQTMPTQQYEAVVLSSAAVLDHFGYKDASKLGLHATTSTSGKWDLGAGTGAIAPYSISKLRADVTARLKAGPTATTPAPPPEDDDMPTMPELTAALLTKADGATLRKDIGYARDQVIAANQTLQATVTSLQATVAGQAAAIGALAADSNVDAESIKAEVQSAVQSAIAGLEVTLAVKPEVQA